MAAKQRLHHTSAPLRGVFRLFALLTSIAMALPVSSQPRVAQIMNGSANPGTSTGIQLRLSDLVGFAGGDFTLRYDPEVISILNVTRAPSTDDFLVVDGNPAPGRLSISMAAGEGLLETGEGAIAVITVEASGASTTGDQTPVTFIGAQWYDELSVRHELMGDNAVFEVGETAPLESDLTLTVESGQGAVGGRVELPLVLSFPEATAQLTGTIVYDALSLQNADLRAGAVLAGWQISADYQEGRIQFSYIGGADLQGVGPVEIARCSFTVSSASLPGDKIPVELESIEVRNSAEFPFQAIPVGGQIEVLPGTSVTPTPTISEPTPTPTVSTIPRLPADFDGNNVVDGRDLVRFLETWHWEVNQ